MTEELIKYGGKDAGVLKRFMQEFFPYTEFKAVGLFKKEHRTDYYTQAKIICEYMGLKSIFEYGAMEIMCHITYVDGHRPEKEGFVSIIPSIYD